MKNKIKIIVIAVLVVIMMQRCGTMNEILDSYADHQLESIKSLSNPGLTIP